MSDQMSLVDLVLNASLIVQVVMALLLIASVISWAIMLRKRAELRRARIDADRFEEVFWSGGDLSSMFRAIDQKHRIFQRKPTLLHAPASVPVALPFSWRAATRARAADSLRSETLATRCDNG